MNDTTKIFVNLPVSDLKRSMDFFSALGFSINKQFTDEKAACLVISDDIYAMLLTEKFFRTFTEKEIIDAKKGTEVIVAISVESKEKVNEIVVNALHAGGKPFRDPEDMGFMYSWSFQDPDDHLWEVLWMAPKHIEQNRDQ